MSKILELREKRTKLWNDAKAFLDSHQKDGILSPEDSTTYERMENDVVALGHEMERLERQAAIDRELAAFDPPLHLRPWLLRVPTHLCRQTRWRKALPRSFVGKCHTKSRLEVAPYTSTPARAPKEAINNCAHMSFL